MNKPYTTYRIQFNSQFTFNSLKQHIPYFKKLGVSTIYAAPIFKALPGSTHGYDVVDPHQINPEIGTEQELFELSHELQKNGISWLQDIVPNHMCFHSENKWLMDVLAKGKDSAYHRFFDLDFPSAMADHRLMVPFLGQSLSDEIAQGNIKLAQREGMFTLAQGDNNWPLNDDSILNVQEALQNKTWEELQDDDQFLAAICDAQHYRLCHWQETEQQINYRRFFTVNSLICLRMEDPAVFETYHRYIIDLVKAGIFQGLRVDHVDGLKDPTTYLTRLRNAVGDDVYLVVEKILAQSEALPNWPIAGSTGYDFLAQVNNLFTEPAAKPYFQKIYDQWTKPLDLSKQVLQKKQAILLGHMQGELAHLVELFIQASQLTTVQLNSLGRASLGGAITAFLEHMSVYRFYGNQWPLPTAEHAQLEQLLDRCELADEDQEAFALLRNTLLNQKNEGKDLVLEFYQRCMQFSGPLMAKGVEDTLMYTYNRFVAHNEVGDTPTIFGNTISQFHKLMQTRLNQQPFAMNASATHDTKRGEDVRARLNVLTDVPQLWATVVDQFMNQYQVHFEDVHPNDAYHLLQVVVGAMPLSKESDFADRVESYVEKALREGKKRSNWPAPNQAYEEKAQALVKAMLTPNHPLYTIVNQSATAFADLGIVNSLTQVILKFTCPGIPDLYQGTELWDFSLVDPDNRRSVDYPLREKLIAELNDVSSLAQLWNERNSGQLKLWLTQKLIALRKANPDLFEQGDYLPLSLTGKYSKHAMAFLRGNTKTGVVVIVPIGLGQIHKGANFAAFDWEDTQVIIPSTFPAVYQNVFDDNQVTLDTTTFGIPIQTVFGELPFAILQYALKADKRGSGILLPIFSLPSDSGIGELGDTAFKFVDLLSETRQTYWQLLPINPTTNDNSHSPYSSYASMAGNPLFIGLSWLVEKGWLNLQQIDVYTSNEGKVNYKKAAAIKAKALSKAYQAFLTTKDNAIQTAYAEFCDNEAYWLSNFANFTALRRYHQDKPWWQWPQQFKLRDKHAMVQFCVAHQDIIEELKWQQFIFDLQWKELKTYANAKNIQLLGDLPFYVAYDSVDVWSNPNCFKLTDQLEMETIAGVPPDAFSADGQLWGMPIFDWAYLAAKDYQWWIQRLSKNLALFDLLRLDHFRAFHSYWEVAANAPTAKAGKWIDGPGVAFFAKVAGMFPQLPFVAEDLGANMKGPIQLRSQFNLPGMKVLQFGFGSDMSVSPHLPHEYEHENYIAYIGTHDNNTARGWYENELNEKGKERLEQYTESSVNAENVHLVMMRLALSSIAKVVILQFQDLIGAGADTRMNTPASNNGNWSWQLDQLALTDETKHWLLQHTLLYGRG